MIDEDDRLRVGAQVAHAAEAHDISPLRFAVKRVVDGRADQDETDGHQRWLRPLVRGREMRDPRLVDPPTDCRLYEGDGVIIAGMTLLLREADVRALVDINDAIKAVDSAFRESAAGQARNQPRRRVSGRGTTLAIMSASLPSRNLVGYKAYTAGPAGARFWVNLFDATDGRLLAMIEADWLGALRTGAVSGLATGALARSDATVLAVFGAGHQAPPQVLAVAAVRPLREVRIVNRDPGRRAALASDLRLRLPQVQVSETSAQEAVAGADIITTITSAGSPLFPGNWIQAGQHLNAAGSNLSNRRELEARAVARADLLVVDDVEAARLEAGDLLLAEQDGALGWARVHSLAEVLAGSVGRSQASDVTIFKSVGLALEDVALGSVVLERARERGLGQAIDL